MVIKTPEILSDDEILLMKHKAAETYRRDLMIISLALGTGLRNNELINLTIEMIRPYDEVCNFLLVPGSISKGGIERQVPLFADLRDSLESFLVWKFENSQPCGPSNFLFLTRFTNNRLNARDFQRIIHGISIKAIGRPIHPHVLRHTFATKLLSVSNLRIVQQSLGHKNIQTTQIYTHPSKNDLTDAFTKLQGSF